jgi:hypothetical protein
MTPGSNRAVKSAASACAFYSSVQRDKQGKTRIASPRSAPEQFFRCLIRMFPAVATRHSVIAWKAAADEVVPNTIS